MFGFDWWQELISVQGLDEKKSVPRHLARAAPTNQEQLHRPWPRRLRGPLLHYLSYDSIVRIAIPSVLHEPYSAPHIPPQ
jgi:hypothetical protein